MTDPKPQEQQDERAGAAQAAFLSRMTHEFRTPMNAILGFAHVLQEELQNAEHRDYVQEIIQAGEQLLTMVDDLLDFANLESGHAQLSIRAVPIGPVVSEALRSVEPLFRQRHMEARVECEAGGAAAGSAPVCAACARGNEVLADADRLRQILTGLLSNAAKHGRSGGSVRLSCRAGGGRVRFSVADDGPGISAERLERLFMPFEAADARSSQGGSAGIGLAVARRLAELMGGGVGVDTAPGRGSAFWLELPQARSAA